MSDRYQPGASLLSFLNPNNRYYVNAGLDGESPVAALKQELAKDLLETNKDLKILETPKQEEINPVAPPDAPEIKPTIEDPKPLEPAPEPTPEPKPEVPATINDMLANADKPKFGPTAAPTNDPDENEIANDIAAAVLGETPVDLPPPEIKKEEVAEIVPTVTATAPTEGNGNEIDLEAATAKSETSGIAAAVAADAVLPGVAAEEIKEEAKAEAVAESFRKNTGGRCACLKGLSKKCKCAGTVPEQAAQAIESFCDSESFIAPRGPSKLIRSLQNAGLKLKGWAIGLGKPQQSNVEKFCDEHWHRISVTLISVIALVILILFGLSAFGLITVLFDIKRNTPIPSQPVSTNGVIGG